MSNSIDSKPYISASAVIETKLTPDEVTEIMGVARLLEEERQVKQLSPKEAVEVAKRNSTLRSRGASWWNFSLEYDRRSEGLHPTRNDVDRHGKPSRKKKGSLKPKKWLK